MGSNDAYDATFLAQVLGARERDTFAGFDEAGTSSLALSTCSNEGPFAMSCLPGSIEHGGLLEGECRSQGRVEREGESLSWLVHKPCDAEKL